MHHLDEISHIAYSDESNYNRGQYRAIAMVSLPSQITEICHKTLKEILCTSGISEFKWNKVNEARMRLAGVKLIDFALKLILEKKMRIDILIWDTQDKRHSIYGRDDKANLERMYYHLFRWVLTEKWKGSKSWALHPDEHSAIDWSNLKNILENKSNSSIHQKDLLDTLLFFKNHYTIKVITECQSIERPLVQIADLFAGMGQYSWNDFKTYSVWKRINSEQPCFDCMFENLKLSGGSQEKWHLIDYSKKQCDLHKWGVSLKSSLGLQTKNHRNGPLNFWLYVSQHNNDKAPTKVKTA